MTKSQKIDLLTDWINDMDEFFMDKLIEEYRLDPFTADGSPLVTGDRIGFVWQDTDQLMGVYAGPGAVEVNKECRNCKHWDEYTGLCLNNDSPYFVSLYNDTCTLWESNG